jgi:hypothetical protein
MVRDPSLIMTFLDVCHPQDTWNFLTVSAWSWVPQPPLPSAEPGTEELSSKIAGRMKE